MNVRFKKKLAPLFFKQPLKVMTHHFPLPPVFIKGSFLAYTSRHLWSIDEVNVIWSLVIHPTPSSTMLRKVSWDKIHDRNFEVKVLLYYLL